jgi:hypothetical protein
MKKTCRNCKFWFKENCVSPKFVYIGKDVGEIKQDELGYYDYSGYNASFITGPDFGCIHFSEKTENEDTKAKK